MTILTLDRLPHILTPNCDARPAYRRPAPNKCTTPVGPALPPSPSPALVLATLRELEDELGRGISAREFARYIRRTQATARTYLNNLAETGEVSVWTVPRRLGGPPQKYYGYRYTR